MRSVRFEIVTNQTVLALTPKFLRHKTPVFRHPARIDKYHSEVGPNDHEVKDGDEKEPRVKEAAFGDKVLIH